MFRRRPAEDAPQGEMGQLVAALRREGHIRSERVAQAMLAADRRLFVAGDAQDETYIDTPLPIGFGQTISAPHMVAIMAEEIRARPGMRVLEVGGGSGWHAAVLAHLVTPGGSVVTVERIEELARRAREALRAAGVADRVEIVVADGSLGHPEGAPYDRISVAAAAPRVPPALVEQLSPQGGRLLVPVGEAGYQELIAVTKEGGEVRQENLGGCAFVPLIGAQGF
jgi:protein-L-isoaspartate(D-aspartate) O-methyltransferase